MLDLHHIILDTIPIFQVLSPQEKEEVFASFEKVSFHMGDTIIQAGERGDSFHLILTGKVRMIGKDQDGKELNLGLMESGSHFGQEALLNEEFQEHTLRASTKLELLRLSRTMFMQIIDAHPELRVCLLEQLADDAMRKFLKRTALFAPLHHQELRSLLDIMVMKEYAPGQAIVSEGEAGDAFYLLRSGTASVLKESEGSRKLNTVKGGEFFGELALLTGDPRKASVVADEAVSVFSLAKNDFDKLIMKFPKVRETIIGIASAYLQNADVPRHTEANVTAEDSAGYASESIAEDAEQEKRRRYGGRRTWRLSSWFPVRIQQSELDCGPTCLSMIAQHYGKRLSIHRLRELAQVGLEGSTLFNLCKTAELIGFQAEAVRSSLKGLAEQTLPAIAHWKGNHYVVVVKVDERYVTVADPGIGLLTYSHDDFLKGWTLNTVFLKPVEAFFAQEESKPSFGRYWAFFASRKQALFHLVWMTVLLQVINLALPLFTQQVIDRVLIGGNYDDLNFMLIVMLGVSLLTMLVQSIREWVIAGTFIKIDIDMIMSFYRHVFRLPMRYFATRKVGDILTRAGENQVIRHFLVTNSMNAVLNVMTIVVYIGIMFTYSVTLAWIALAFIPCFIALTLIVTPLMKRNSRKQFQADVDLQNVLVETIGSMRTVKALAAEDEVRKKVEGKFRQSTIVQMKGWKIGIFSGSVATVLQTLSGVTVLYAGAEFIIGEKLTVGELMAFSAVYALVTNAALGLIGMWDEFQSVRIALERLDDVFETEEEESDPTRLTALPKLQGAIEFERVSFRYDSDGKNVLQNISFDMAPGQTIGIVGRSGSGKSTLANLLLKLYAPSSGTVRIDGHDLKQVQAATLRKQIGVVQQEAGLFSGTIHENIAYQIPDASMDEVMAASMLAGAHEFIMTFPNGYDTQVGERGASLSGGQRQRIAIARALIGNPRILIFDEATSALDNESEKTIQRNMSTILKDRTTLIIAHRLSTIRHADRILVLDQGVIAESGTHEQLMAAKGLYHMLVSQPLD
ncbi:bacteriocin-processing peptidase [Aneurinibacillus soli]|uniref:Toxin RTX-I translocation ATP-binding protein n=1 Tax=Aneurinibacillus soli TaxID=1500254 RepID=A0A0U5AW67_9BACL|nr:peptidase domain-containing ABC transporter [Aneurinibacillus soli]PYE64040.1 bacteriocin-processing peptidase [Aneurinibacillus soli]BAU27989.1 Toxin RTX-I translocation ATP-binding protein [Aneurinibacillus soli]